MEDNKTTLLPKTDEPIDTKTTAQMIKELSELGSMNHRTMIAKAKYTDFMNPYHMSDGNKTSVKTTPMVPTGAAWIAELTCLQKRRDPTTPAAW